MDLELLSRARIHEIEREMSRIHLAAAAGGKLQHRRAVPEGKPGAVPAVPRRVLRALRQAL
jgi:hypothetical protein